MESIQNRLYSIDILKAICAFLVVCIHVPFPGILGEYLIVEARIAVPIFFMISGYFYTIKTKNSISISRRKVQKQITNIIWLVIVSNTLYFIWGIISSEINGISVNTYITNIFTVQSLIEFLVLNESPFSGHLWYLSAILYTLVIVWIIDRYKKFHLLIISTPILLLIDLIFGKYSLLIFKSEFSYIFTRNFLFVGIPFFCIGAMLKRYEDRLQSINGNFLIMLIIIFFLTGILEHYFLVYFDINATRDQYISTIFLSIVVFIFVLRKKRNNYVGIGKLISNIGRNYSTWIYILHPIVITIFGFLSNKIGLYTEFIIFAPFIIFVITTLLLFIIMCIKRKLIS